MKKMGNACLLFSENCVAVTIFLNSGIIVLHNHCRKQTQNCCRIEAFRGLLHRCDAVAVNPLTSAESISGCLATNNEQLVMSAHFRLTGPHGWKGGEHAYAPEWRDTPLK